MGQGKGEGWSWRCWRAIWPWLVASAVFAVISWFSAQPGTVSDAQSLRVQEMLGRQSAKWEVLVRKMAHVALFMALGASCCFAWIRSLGRPIRLARAVVCASALCLALAALDELHQTFVDERAGLVIDVALDWISAALGTLGMAGLALLYGKWKSSAGRGGK